MRALDCVGLGLLQVQALGGASQANASNGWPPTETLLTEFDTLPTH